MKKGGYRLTSEEEKQIGREAAGQELPAQSEPVSGAGPRKNTWGGVIALCGALVLMVGIAYFFFGLLSGPGPIERATEAMFSPEQKMEIAARLRLTPEENAAFWPVFVRFRQETEQWLSQRPDSLKDWGKGEVSVSGDEAVNEGYSPYNEEYKSMVSRYVQAFSVVVAPEKIPEILLISEEMDGEK